MTHASTTILADAAGGLSPALQLAIYCGVVGLASLAGGAFAASFRLGHRRLQFALSFVAGTMLGVGVLHLLPHAVILSIEASPAAATSHGALHASLDGVMLAAVLGFVAMFLLERFFHFHQHETPEEAGHHDCCEDACEGHTDAASAAGSAAKSGERRAHGHSHGHAHSHAHGHASKHSHGGPKKVSELGWVGAAVGLTLHSILEGVALAAAVLAGATHGDTGAIAGLSTFLVILLHKPFDGLTVATLVRAAGRPAAFAHAVNALFALVVPVGAALLWFGVSESGAEILPYALAFSAGTFLCIATSDLLPELQFHRHDRVGLSAALLVGLAVAGTIARIESSVAQSHDHGHDHSGDAHDHSDHSHEALPNPTKPAETNDPGHDHDHSDPNHTH
jgi:zinc and cadmium transporter